MALINRWIVTVCVGLVLFCAQTVLANATKVLLKTTQGDIVIELDEKAAPGTVDNFLSYIRDGHYKGTIFHRVIKGFMIQGGGFTTDMQQKATKPPIANEAHNGLKNGVGTVAMARTRSPHSATAQFFINVADNGFLNYQEKTTKGWGYCVFGKVIQGLDAVKSIEDGPTGSISGHRDVPVTPIIINQAIILKEE